MEERCPFSDPVVVAELKAISVRVREAVRLHEVRVNRVLWLLFTAAVVCLVVQKQTGASMVVPGWRGVLLIFVAPLPLIGLVLWLVLGEKRTIRRVYREQGLYCLSCDRVPTDSGGDDLDVWIVARRCPHCEGPLKRFETEQAT